MEKAHIYNNLKIFFFQELKSFKNILEVRLFLKNSLWLKEWKKSQWCLVNQEQIVFQKVTIQQARIVSF